MVKILLFLCLIGCASLPAKDYKVRFDCNYLGIVFSEYEGQAADEDMMYKAVRKGGTHLVFGGYSSGPKNGFKKYFRVFRCLPRVNRI